jgi:hypothetical protein
VDTKSITHPAVARNIGVRKLLVKNSPVAWQWGENPAPEKNQRRAEFWTRRINKKGRVKTLPSSLLIC